MKGFTIQVAVKKWRRWRTSLLLHYRW